MHPLTHKRLGHGATLTRVATGLMLKGLKGPVPFGYNGAGTGTRALLQNNLLTVPNVAAHWAWCKTGPSANIGTVSAHTANNPVCLLALLNGGYSPSSKTWGQAFIHLTV